MLEGKNSAFVCRKFENNSRSSETPSDSYSRGEAWLLEGDK